MGARQLVVQEAFETMVSDGLSVWWLTPKTMVLLTSCPPGAEMSTFFAPAFRCFCAFACVVKKPVHSNTISMFRACHGHVSGSLCWVSVMVFP